MPTRSPGAARHLRTLFNLGAIRELADGQLLERSATRDGEAAELAFAALVERHGPMVLRACRSVLRDPHDAEDAFQATFVVLSRRAGGLWVRETIGPWLFSVALRVARRARTASLRRARHERRSAERAVALRDDRPGLDPELESALHEELDRLAPRWREPIVLCDLQGRTYDEAARQLGLPVGTLKSRLARGRSRLGDRLRRRGLAPTLGLIGTSVVPPPLIDATSAVAIRAATARLATGTVPAAVASLAHGVLRMMRLHAMMNGMIATLALALTCAGIVHGAGIGAAQEGPPPGRSAEPVSAPAPSPRTDPADEGPMVAFEVSFLEVPGLGLHAMGFEADDSGEGSPAGIAFLSDLEAGLIGRDVIPTIPGASSLRAPKVTTRPGDWATIMDTRTMPDHTEAGHARLEVAEGGRLALELDDQAPADDPPSSRGSDARTAGRTVDLRGEVVETGRRDYVAIDFDIRETHVVEVHTVVISGDAARTIDIPEVVKATFDRRVTIPDGGIVLIDLGLFRTVDDAGESSIAQHLVMVKAELVPAPVDPEQDGPAPVPLPVEPAVAPKTPAPETIDASRRSGAVPFSFFIGAFY